MPTFRGTVVSELDYTVIAENSEQAMDFILEAFGEEFDFEAFDYTKVKDITEVK